MRCAKLSPMSGRFTVDRECRRELLAGARDTIPLLLGAAPFGLIFGALAAPSGLAAPGAVAMSAFVFAGASQFIALTLLASGTGAALIVFTTLIVNLRHALYAATLLPHVARLPLRWRAALAFALTDETFAVVQQRYAGGDTSGRAHWYFLGSCVAMYGNWQLWTVAGVWLGHGEPQLQRLGLEFAMAATFSGMVAPLLRRLPMAGAALVAGAVALLAHGLPYKLGLLLAALAGVAAGVLFEEMRDGSRREAR